MSCVINVNSAPKVLFIGNETENDARRISFDVSPWVSEFGAGAVQLLIKRPGEADAYSVLLTVADGLADWMPSSTDTAIPGTAEIALAFTAGAVSIRTGIIFAVVDASIATGTTPPPSLESWVDQLGDLAETAQNAATAAENAAGSVQASADQIAANTADIATLKKSGISPSMALLNTVLVPDFEPITAAARTVKKLGNQIYVRRTGTGSNGLVVALTGDEVRTFTGTLSSYVPNVGNLIPISKLNPVLFSVQDKPTASNYTSALGLVYCSVDEQQAVTVLSKQNSELDDAVDKIVPLVPATPDGATHFALFLYTRQAQGLPSDSDMVITLDYAPEHLFNQIAALQALALENN